MPTALQNFREQYPQYNEVDDEELAEGIRERFYPDMGIAEYRRSIGLPPPPVEPEPPGVWDRVKSAFSSEQDKPEAILSDKPDMATEFADPEEPPPPQDQDRLVLGPGVMEGIEGPEPEARRGIEPPLADQLMAGFDEYRANKATAASFDIIEDYRLVEDVAMGRREPRGAAGGPLGVSPGSIGKFARASRAEGGDPRAQKQIRREMSSQREKLTGMMQAVIDNRREWERRAATVPYSPETQDVLQAEGFTKAMREVADDPIQIMSEIALRSLPNMTETIPMAAIGAMAGPAGFALALGTGEAIAEYRASFAEALQKNGVDLNDAESMLAAADDDALMREVHEYALTRSTIIGTAGAISGGISTKPLTPFIKNMFGRELSNVAAQTVVQAGFGGLGEAGAILATEGAEVLAKSGGEVVAEMIGEMPGGVIEVGTATLTGVRGAWADGKAARVESEVDEILGDRVGPEPEDVPRGTPPPTPPPPAPEPEPTAPEPVPPEPEVLPPEEAMGPPTEPMGPPEPMGPRAPEEEAAAAPEAPAEPMGPPAPGIPEGEPSTGVQPGTPVEPTAPQPRGAVPEPVEPETPPQVQYSDARLKRSWYRGALQDMANDLTVGGDVAYTYDDQGNIDGRTKSINPQWFQALGADPLTHMSVRQVQQAVNKAITGKRLGIKQVRVTQAMLDIVTEERLEHVDYAKQQLDEARGRRAAAKDQAGLPETPEDEFAGELFNEEEYAPDQDADSRIIYELMERAAEAGVDEGTLERFALQFEDNNELITQLEAAINERVSAAGPEAAPTQPAPRPEAPAAPAPEPRPAPEPGTRKPTTPIQADALQQAQGLTAPFSVTDLAALPQKGGQRTITFNTITGLIRKGYLRPVNPEARLNDQMLVVVGQEPEITPEADPLRANPAEHPAKTGEPFKAKLFRGSGRTDQESVYSSVPEPLLGRDVQYWAFDPGTAGTYGPDIAEEVVDLKNPLVIDSDDEFRAWHKRAGNPWFLNPFVQLEDPKGVEKVRMWGREMVKAAKDAGHDGVILQWNPREPGDIDPQGRVIKRMDQVWGHPTVIAFKPPYTEVRATTRYYDDSQLELYLESPPVPTQAGAPRLAEAKAAAGDALENLRATPSVLANRFRGGFADRQKVDLLGQVVESRLDLAVMAQAYRDPRFETLRVFFVDDTRTVVSQVGLTSRLPASSSALVGTEIDPYLADLHAAAKTKGATGYYMLHNHPSGTSNPSHADEAITKRYAETMPGFLGHVVIDQNNWSEINAAGTSTYNEQDLGAADYRAKGGVAGGRIDGPGDLVMMAKAYALQAALGVGNNDVVLVVADQRHRVQNVSLLPSNRVTGDPKRDRRQVLRAALANQGSRIFAIGRDERSLMPLADFVVDILVIDDQGKYTSMAEQGVITSAEQLFPRSRVARVSPDTSPEFDYLKPISMQERRGEAYLAGEAPAVVREDEEDMFGGDKRQQELADEIRRRDEARNRGQEEVETGDIGDMFSQAQRQEDLFAEREQIERGPERRKVPREEFTERRKQKMAAKTTDELVTEFYTDPMTGLANRTAFNEEAPHHAYLASIDVDSLKWVNDYLSPDAGDAMLVAMGEALDQTGIDAYHISGDEFYLGAETEADLQGAISMAKGILDAQIIETPKGRKVGVGFTAGIGADKLSADLAMKAEKSRRTKTGERAQRGTDLPPGATLSVRAPPVLDAEAGTNHVPLIGQRGNLPIDPNNNLILGNGRHVKIPKAPVRREHIIHIMRRHFGNRIYQGRVKGKNRLGFYRPGQGELRLKNHNDIEVAAHEIAHWMDDRYPWIARLYKKYRQEMLGVSYDAELIFEGYAEFMRLFFTQESEAMKQAPGFYDAFVKELANDKTLQAALFDLQQMMHAWTQQGARKRLASKMGFNNVGGTIASFYERARRRFNVSIFQAGLDGVRRWKEIEQAVMGTDTSRAYEKIRLALGGSNGILESAVFYGTPGWREDGQGIEMNGDSLMDIFGTAWGTDDLAHYMVARRGLELHNQGRENLLRPDEIAAGLRIGAANPEFADMFDRYQQFNSRMLDFAEAAGILNDATRAAMEEMNQNYVPFHRIIESMINGTAVRTGGNPFQRLKGGTQNINNVWDNMINNTGFIIKMSMVNDAKRDLLRMLGGTDRLGAGRRNALAGTFAAPISTDAKPVKIQSQQVLKKVLEAMGWTMMDYRAAKEGMIAGANIDEEIAKLHVIESMVEGLGEMVTFFQLGQDPSGAVDYYLDNGKKHWFEIIDPGLWDSLQYLGPKGSNLLLSVFGGFSATLRRGVVAVPVFQLKNFIRDTTNAWLLSTNVKVPAARALRAVFSRMQHDPDYQEMLLNGGGFANRSQGLEAQRKVIIDPTRLVAIYDRFMGRFENANRLAEYKAAKAAGESPRRAALLSREISTDFAMRGSHNAARFLAIAVPFLNARVQGLYRVKRQADSKQQIASYAIRGMALATATAALWALNKDDDRWKELPEDIKDLYWVFFTGDGEDDYVLIPKPFESGMIWGTIPERMLNYTQDENGKEFVDAIGWIMLETFNLDMTPQVFQPMLDLSRNKKWTGAPITPMYLDNVEPSDQYQYYTAETIIEAAEKFNISPIKLEFALRGYLGTLGTYAIAASDALYRASTDPEERRFGEEPGFGETWRDNVIVRYTMGPMVPGEGPPRRTKFMTDLYDVIREGEKVAATIALRQKRYSDEVHMYLTENEVLYALNPDLISIRQTLNKFRTDMDTVRGDKTLTGAEKRALIWEITRARNQVAREAAALIEETKAMEKLKTMEEVSDARFRQDMAARTQLAGAQ